MQWLQVDLLCYYGKYWWTQLAFVSSWLWSALQTVLKNNSSLMQSFPSLCLTENVFPSLHLIISALHFLLVDLPTAGEFMKVLWPKTLLISCTTIRFSTYLTVVVLLPYFFCRGIPLWSFCPCSSSGNRQCVISTLSSPLAFSPQCIYCSFLCFNALFFLKTCKMQHCHNKSSHCVTLWNQNSS